MAEQKQWSCTMCTFLNSNLMTKCEMCQSQKKIPKDKKESSSLLGGLFRSILGLKNEDKNSKITSNKTFFDKKYEEVKNDQDMMIETEEKEILEEKRVQEFKIKQLQNKCSIDIHNHKREQFNQDTEHYSTNIKINYESIKQMTININQKQQICDKMRSQINAEEKALSKFEQELQDSNIRKIVLLGNTGGGKSTFANRLCGDHSLKCNAGLFKISNEIQSETQDINKVVIQTNNFDYKLSVIDTPGNFDSYGNDRMHANNLVEYLKGCGGVNSFVIVKSILNPRLDFKFQQYLSELTKMLGINFWKHVSIVLTHKSYADTQTKEFATYCKDLNREIQISQNLNKLNENINIPIIGIDNYDEKENYLTQINKLLNITKTTPYQCHLLTSPLQEYKDKYQDELVALNNRYQALNELNIQHINLNQQMCEIEQLLVIEQNGCILNLQQNVSEKDDFIVGNDKRIVSLKNRINSLNQQIKYKNEKIENYDQQFLSFKNEINVQHIEMKTQELRITGFMSDINELNETITDLRKTNQKQLSNIQSKEQDIIQYQYQCRSKDTQISSKQDALNALREQLMKVELVKEEYQQKYDELVDECHVKDSQLSSTLEELREEFERMESVKDEYREKYNNLVDTHNDSIEEKRDKYNELVCEYNELSESKRNKYNELVEQYNDLNRKLSKYKDETWDSVKSSVPNLRDICKSLNTNKNYFICSTREGVTTSYYGDCHKIIDGTDIDIVVQVFVLNSGEKVSCYDTDCNIAVGGIDSYSLSGARDKIRDYMKGEGHKCHVFVLGNGTGDGWHWASWADNGFQHKSDKYKVYICT
eukprot:250396_1